VAIITNAKAAIESRITYFICFSSFCFSLCCGFLAAVLAEIEKAFLPSLNNASEFRNRAKSFSSNLFFLVK